MVTASEPEIELVAMDTGEGGSETYTVRGERYELPTVLTDHIRRTAFARPATDAERELNQALAGWYLGRYGAMPAIHNAPPTVRAALDNLVLGIMEAALKAGEERGRREREG